MTFSEIQESWSQGLLPRSLLINVDNLDVCFQHLKQVFSNIFECTTDVIDYHPNLMIVKRKSEGEGQKFITVSQIREISEFLNKTSILDKPKIVVILGAEYMNPNAANCCLKILEEISQSNYIILATCSLYSLPLTVVSRCHIIRVKESYLIESDIPSNKQQSINKELFNCLGSSDLKSILDLTSIVNNNVTEDWVTFTDLCITFLAKTIKHKAGVLTEYTKAEYDLLDKIKVDIIDVIKTYEELKIIIETTIKQDLDRKNATIIILNKMKKVFSN